MDIQSISRTDDNNKKKKVFIIALIILFLLSLIGGSVYFLTKPSTPTGDNSQLLSDLGLLAPRDGVATSSLKRLPFIELVADHPTVSPGQTTKISWVASNATTCVNGNGDSLDLTGSLSISPTEPYTFDVLCTGPNGTQSQTITIGVTTAPIIELIATPPAVLSGKQSYISWNTSNADRCEDSEGKTLRLSSGFSIKPTVPYTFSMSCVGPKGTTKKSITVKIATPFASGTGTPGAGTSGSTGGTYTDTSTGITYNSDGTVYSGSSYGNNTGGSTGSDTTIGSTGSDFSPTPTKTNLAAKSFIIELTATPNPIPFDGTAKLSWKVTNLGTIGRCTIRTSNNTGTPYLPIGSFSGTSLSKTVTTHRMTSSETITLACTKGSEELVQTLDLTVGPPPPLPDPEINSFSVIVKNAPKQDYAATGDVLTVKFETNNSVSKIDKCELWRNDGQKNTFIKSVPQKGGSLDFNERVAGKNIYALECSRGSGESLKVARMTSTTPDHISVVNCTFPNGFGDTPDKVSGSISGKVVLDTFTAGGTRTPTNQPICTYAYGDELGSSIHGLWGFAREIQPGSEKYLCPYTAYSAYRFPDGLHTSGSQGLNTGFWLDALYHPNWEYLASTVYSHPTNCGGGYGLTYWVPAKAAYTETITTGDSASYTQTHPATPGHFTWQDFPICGPPVVVVNSLTCLVK